MAAGACTLCTATALVYTDAARDAWKGLFTPADAQGADAETMVGVLADIDMIWPSVMLFLITDGLYALNGGLMRGLGLQVGIMPSWPRCMGQPVSFGPT